MRIISEFLGTQSLGFLSKERKSELQSEGLQSKKLQSEENKFNERRAIKHEEWGWCHKSTRPSIRQICNLQTLVEKIQFVSYVS